jgi:hypothetical protein
MTWLPAITDIMLGIVLVLLVWAIPGIVLMRRLGTPFHPIQIGVLCAFEIMWGLMLAVYFAATAYQGSWSLSEAARHLGLSVFTFLALSLGGALALRLRGDFKTQYRKLVVTCFRMEAEIILHRMRDDIWADVRPLMAKFNARHQALLAADTRAAERAYRELDLLHSHFLVYREMESLRDRQLRFSSGFVSLGILENKRQEIGRTLQGLLGEIVQEV